MVHDGHNNPLTTWEGYVDWRNRPSLRGRHGGMLAASFILVVEILENLAFLANSSNLVLYLSKRMHFSPAKSANVVTNFMGTAFLLALLGGFLSDAFITTYWIYIISAIIESLGLLILTMQAHIPTLKPIACTSDNRNEVCQQLNTRKAAMLFSGLYLVALGVGGIKGSLPPHGAEQFDEHTSHGRRQRSTFFNYYVFCLSTGALIAVTFVAWIEDNKGWQWGYGIATATILTTIPVFLLGRNSYRIKVPTGSPITTIFKVLVGAVSNFCLSKRASTSPSHTDADADADADAAEENITQTNSMRFLNRGTKANLATKKLDCTVKQVEDVKIVRKTLPIFMSTIMLNCCLAQLSTYSVQQAATMDTMIGSLKVPPASLPVFPVVFIMILAPVYNHIIVPLARKVTKTETGITQLQRIGTGLILSVIAMAIAALVETKRKKVAIRYGMMNSKEPLPITFLWVALQYLFLGSADLFSLAGMMDFFFAEAPISMRSLATSLSWASLAMGYYLSSLLVSLVNRVTTTKLSASGSGSGWLHGTNINHYHLERFYWFLCILSGFNFMHYLIWTCRYQYRSTKEENELNTYKSIVQCESNSA